MFAVSFYFRFQGTIFHGTSHLEVWKNLQESMYLFPLCWGCYAETGEERALVTMDGCVNFAGFVCVKLYFWAECFKIMLEMDC